MTHKAVDHTFEQEHVVRVLTLAAIAYLFIITVPAWAISPSTSNKKSLRGQTSNAMARARRDAFPSKTRSYAKVLTQSLVQAEKGQGFWRGKIEGNGEIKLFLQIHQKGRMESRYMGSVKLVNKSSTFAFKTALPNVGRWSWKVAAYAS